MAGQEDIMDWCIAKENLPEGELVSLNGDFDMYEGPRFAQEMIAHIRGGHARLVLDLSMVEYLDSCGVGVIIKILQLVRQAGGGLKLRGLHGTPRKVLEMSNVLSLLEELPSAPSMKAGGARSAGETVR
jgi:anti-sigma B factor antagonist